jgi:protein TonB
VVRKGAFSYPSSAAEEGVEGTVVLEVLVDEKGEVAKVKIASSSGDGRLDGAAQDWIKGWRYLPAVQDGRPRRVWTKAKVVFRLE